MEVLEKAQVDDSLDYQFFKTKEDKVPFWDHPNLKGSKVLPQKYYPTTSIEGVLNDYKRKLIDDTDLVLLKVLGDAICANENQLRRYMDSVTSHSDTSKRLDRLRTYAYVERWKVRVRGEDDENSFKPPAPFTLGVAGFQLLKHFYNDQYFVEPSKWNTYGIGGIKRYVAMNELRCLMAEQKSVKKWKWNAILADNRRLKFPMAAAEMKTPKGNVNFIIDRAQMNQNFVGFFRDKLEAWKRVHEKYDAIPISEFPDHMSFVVIFVSTLSVAQHLHQQVMLDTYPFNIWVCVEEDVLTDGLSTSFYVPNKEKLKRIRVDF